MLEGEACNILVLCESNTVLKRTTACQSVFSRGRNSYFVPNRHKRNAGTTGKKSIYVGRRTI
jgi:hypothetical protein